jgi:nitroimidazol reductase NimA-like FMN-containing flavoprotein (pyridoxamine 5'-phosphate oxidase superfamily)
MPFVTDSGSFSESREARVSAPDSQAASDRGMSRVTRAIIRGPRLRALSKRQIESVLSRNHIARLAFVNDGRLELLPIHYVFANGCCYGRTAFGTKYVAWLEGPAVLLEVDESEGPCDWRSVVARGTITLLRTRGADALPVEYWSAVTALRTFLPTAFTDEDATPQRTAIFRVQPTELTGREAMSR